MFNKYNDAQKKKVKKKSAETQETIVVSVFGVGVVSGDWNRDTVFDGAFLFSFFIVAEFNEEP